MVAPGQHRGTSRRAQGRSVELVVEETALREPLCCWSAHEPTIHAGPAKAYVIQQHQKDVGRSLWRCLRRRKIGSRFRRVHLDLGVRKLPSRLRQMCAIQAQWESRLLSV